MGGPYNYRARIFKCRIWHINGNSQVQIQSSHVETFTILSLSLTMTTMMNISPSTSSASLPLSISEHEHVHLSYVNPNYSNSAALTTASPTQFPDNCSNYSPPLQNQTTLPTISQHNDQTTGSMAFHRYPNGMV